MALFVDYHPTEQYPRSHRPKGYVFSCDSLVSPQDLSETEITRVVPRIEDAIESPTLTPPTPEALLPNLQLPRALTPLYRVTVGVVTPTWPESLPAVEYLPPRRLAPIDHLSADVKKLLQGGLDGLQQVGHYHHRQTYDDIHC